MKLPVAVFALSLVALHLRADSFGVTFESAGQQTVDVNKLCSGIGLCVVGQQNFNNWAGGGFTTDFGTNGAISGTYSGGIVRYAADQYGGAGGTGYFPETYAQNVDYSLNLSTNYDLPGVNYFGLWFSALDAGNLLRFYDKGQLLYAFTPADFMSLVGTCAGSNPFCGNPNQAFALKDNLEQFAFLNFFDESGTFDQVVFSETGNGGFESDNHTVAYMNPAQPNSGTLLGTYSTPVSTPEPGTLTLVGFALLLVARRCKKERGLR